jgi:hypothetical protein
MSALSRIKLAEMERRRAENERLQAALRMVLAALKNKALDDDEARLEAADIVRAALAGKGE